MSTLQLVEELCTVSEQMLHLVKTLAVELANNECLTQAEADALAEVDMRVSQLLDTQIS
jgi:hypothetical protein